VKVKDPSTVLEIASVAMRSGRLSVTASRRLALLVIGMSLLASCGARTDVFGEDDNGSEPSSGGSFSTGGAPGIAGSGGGAGAPTRLGSCYPGVAREILCVEGTPTCIGDPSIGNVCWCSARWNGDFRWECQNPDGS
jgi:hypothetical protein